MFNSFQELKESVYTQFLMAPVVKPSHWQGRSVVGKPEMETYELLNHSSTLWLPDEDLDGYRKDIKPDLPWADDHFEERVCGYPLNPGIQWSKWRLGKGADDFRDKDGRFNHNYMERFWPKFARMVPPSNEPHPEWLLGLHPHRGIHYEYGDLRDVVNLLQREPQTRQAFLPMFFPEDTGAVHRDRTPCSLGWQFILRDDKLHCVYFLRSVDVVNHWMNDIYFAIRMVLWMLHELRKIDSSWEHISTGTLTTHITSFHCFKATYHHIRGYLNEKATSI